MQLAIMSIKEAEQEAEGVELEREVRIEALYTQGEVILSMTGLS